MSTITEKTDDPRDAEFYEALEAVREFAYPATREAGRRLAARWLRTSTYCDGSLLAAFHALQEAEGEISDPAADRAQRVLDALHALETAEFADDEQTLEIARHATDLLNAQAAWDARVRNY